MEPIDTNRNIKSECSCTCELCLTVTTNEDSIHIYTDRRQELNISQVLIKYFSFLTLEENVKNNPVICLKCWLIVKEFHSFYDSVVKAQQQLNLQSKEKSLNDVPVKDLLHFHIKTEAETEIYSSNTNSPAASPKSLCSDINEGQSHNDEKDNSVANEDGIDSNSSIKDSNQLFLEHYDMKCQICSFQNVTFKTLITHYRKVHKMKGYVECCNKQLFTHTKALEHLHIHLNPEMFKCETCQKICKSKHSLAGHMLTHVPEDERIYKCTECLKTFSSRYSLRKHENKHTQSSAKPFSCHICDRTFSSKGSLQTHIKSIHERAYEQICAICARVFNSKGSYELHYRSFHENIKIERIQCTICGTKHKGKYNFNKHMRRHMESNIKCDICGKEAPNMHALNAHKQRSHFAKHIYECTMCEKKFKRELALKEHMATHTGEVLYQCNFCPTTFNSSANMYTHNKKKHFVEWQNWKQSKDNVNIQTQN